MKLYKVIIVSLIFIVLFSCTENPFFSDDKGLQKEKISGRILLNDGSNPDGIFVWLETFNLSTYTDSDGKFSFSLPLPENQAGGTGYEGKFHLYFFIGNYRADSVEIEFNRGELLSDQDNINNNGKLRNSVVLDPLITVETTEFKDCLIDNDHFEIEFDDDSIFQIVDIELEVFSRTQVVHSYREDRKWPEKGFFRTGMIFIPLEDGYDPVFIKSPEAFYYHDAALAFSTNTWSFELGLRISDFEEIFYEVYPYLIIDQPGLPNGLWEALGKEKLKFDSNYLDFPFKRKPAKILVIKDTD